MKKLLTSFILLSFITIFSQEYHFDTILTYEVNSNLSNTKPFNVNWFLNSNDNSYYLSVYDFEDKKAKLIDFKNNLIHKFKNQSKVVDSKMNFFFEYISSKKIPIVNNRNLDSLLSIKVLNETKEEKEFLVTENTGLKYKLTLGVSEKELLHAVTPLIFERYVKPEDLKFTEFYVINTAEIISQNSVGIKFKLQNIENQDIDVKIEKPKK